MKKFMQILARISLIISTTVLIQMCILHYSQAAEIFSDCNSTIMIDGDIVVGDSARLVKAIGTTNLSVNEMLTIVIDSNGGNADVALTMMSILRRWKYENDNKIRTIVYSKAFSGGAMIFLVGDERLVGQNARLMFHEVAFYDKSGTRHTIEEVEAEGTMSPSSIKSAKDLNALLYNMLIQYTKLPVSYVKDGKYLSAGTALKYNVATGILTF